ncbi:SDR family oxidoreductase [Sporobolomyces salmoneus]|uniref:SDR family oxidoreductase n=1 Tax=Sporobolomyces salmoneus TaxID=183962 RepID=UPI003177CCF5
MSAQQQLVLVTGGTGFVASSVILAYLEKGFKVRATARSQEKIDRWNSYQRSRSVDISNLSWVIVKDIASDGAFDEAIKGVTILAHTASPFHYDIKDVEEDMLIPALKGTRSALKAAQREESVKRVVVTSSFASVLDFGRLGPETTFTEKDWNPATYEETKKMDPSKDQAQIYCASKVIAEQEAWKIAKESESNFALSTVCPPLIFGPPQQPIDSMEAINTSAGAVWGIVDAEKVPETSFPVWTDVRDIAKIHVLASTEEVAKGQRYLTIAGHFDNAQIANFGRQAFPAQASRFPPDDSKPASPHFSTDSSKVEKELGIEFIPFRQSVKDTLEELFEVEQRIKKN